MPRFGRGLLTAILTALPTIGGAIGLVELAQGAEPVAKALFDGQSLDGWEGNRDLWHVVDGVITAETPEGEKLGKNEFLFWKDDLGDFDLTVEFRLSGGSGANSGLQFRSARHDDGSAAGLQADMDQGATWLGRIYDEHGRALLVERGMRVSIAPDGRRWEEKFAEPDDFKDLTKPGEWNTYRIRATGPHVEVWVNGRRTAVLDDHQTDEAEYTGRFGIQLHSGPGPAKIEVRRVEVQELGETAVPAAAPIPADEENRQTQSGVLWHLRPNPAKPSPVENDEAQKLVADMLLTDGFQAELIAAEPDIHQPVAMAFDARGRLWIAEAFSYPVRQPKGEGKDRIRILEDSDGDGVFETKKTFAEGLNLVSGLEVGFGGVWVGAAPELLFIPDADGDDIPDGPPQVLLDGFGYADTHETLNSFTWGPDGWLYGNQGVFNTAHIGKPGAEDEDRIELRAGVWRYRPVRHEFEIIAHGGSNQWGLAFNEVGDLFMTHCRSKWGGGGTTYLIRNGQFWNQTNSNYPDYISSLAPDDMPWLRNYLPASARYDHGEGGAGAPGSTEVYGGHAHVGTMIYLGDNWPAIYRDHLFTHNLQGHQLNHQINVRQGSAYETFHGGYDLLHVPDPTYAAIDLAYGPDGAVYSIDWADKQHCHNPHAEKWDRTNGRVYRMSWAKTYKPVLVDLRPKTDRELIALFDHPNRWYADTARRILQERAAAGLLDAAAIDSLRHAVKQPDLGGTPLLDALWTLHVTDSLDAETLAAVLQNPDEQVRGWAVRLATDNAAQLAISSERLLDLAEHDPSPAVRLAVASAIPLLPTDDRWLVVAALAAHADDADDRFLPGLIWSGLGPIATDDVPRALALADSTPLRGLADSIDWLLARDDVGRDALVAKLITTTSLDEAERLLTIMAFSLRFESKLDAPADWSQVQAKFATADHSQLHRSCDELSAVFHDEAVLAEYRERVADRSADLEARKQALTVLDRVKDELAIDVFAGLLDDTDLRATLIPLLGRSKDTAVAQKLLATFGELDDKDRPAALGVLTARKEFAFELLAAVEAGSFERQNLSALQIRQMQNLKDADLTARLEQVWGKVGESSADAKQKITQVRETFEAAPVWAFDIKRGQEIYQKTCAQCHPLDDKTPPVGPNIAGAARNGLDYFLENIVDPNAVVGENFRTTVVNVADGTVVMGLVDSENDNTLVLRSADKTISIPKSEIEERSKSDLSLMPVGLLNNLSDTDTIALLKFLLTRDRPPPEPRAPGGFAPLHKAEKRAEDG